MIGKYMKNKKHQDLFIYGNTGSRNIKNQG
jgi:hypothetical protein